MLEIGSPAPDFTLRSTSGNINLKETVGRHIILVFYPADGTSVCSSQLALYNEVLPLFEEYNAKLLAISTDDLESHSEFAKKLKLDFPLLTDTEPKGTIAKAYGVYDETRNIAQRALFIIDEQGIIRWRHLSPINVNPGADGILRGLESLKKRMCEYDGS
ncbi:MAG: redoxin domain-containing protein [Candidatus Hodarchaeales archaeon]